MVPDMLMLSPNFYLREFVQSDAALRLCIDNTPGTEAIEEMHILCEMLLEPLRAQLGKPISISSGYRSPALNAAIGGADNSAHTHGRAADLKSDGLSPADLAAALFATRAPFDQAIIEFGAWLHVAMAPRGVAPRRDFLLAVKRDGKTAYYPASLP